MYWSAHRNQQWRHARTQTRPHDQMSYITWKIMGQMGNRIRQIWVYNFTNPCLTYSFCNHSITGRYRFWREWNTHKEWKGLCFFKRLRSMLDILENMQVCNLVDADISTSEGRVELLKASKKAFIKGHQKTWYLIAKGVVATNSLELLTDKLDKPEGERVSW